MNEDDAVRAALSQYYDSDRPVGYAALFRAGWDAGRVWEKKAAKLDVVLRAAIDVADAAFTDQRSVIGTSLHRPMQRLIDALSDLRAGRVTKQRRR